MLKVEPEGLRLLASTAMRDIAHLLRPAHLQQLSSILDDPEATGPARTAPPPKQTNKNTHSTHFVTPTFQSGRSLISRCVPSQRQVRGIGAAEECQRRSRFASCIANNVLCGTVTAVHCQTGMVLPSCQDTGTGIVVGKRSGCKHNAAVQLHSCLFVTAKKLGLASELM